jgi:hypothetical protein
MQHIDLMMNLTNTIIIIIEPDVLKKNAAAHNIRTKLAQLYHARIIITSSIVSSGVQASEHLFILIIAKRQTHWTVSSLQ